MATNNKKKKKKKDSSYNQTNQGKFYIENAIKIFDRCILRERERV